MTEARIGRRTFCLSGALAAIGLAAGPLSGKASAPRTAPSQRYRIAVCDWMILKRQKLGAFKRTHEIGADGVELDMGGLGNRPTFDSKLMDPIERARFKAEVRKYNLEICSMAMSGFYAQSFAERETVPLMVKDTINTMELMGVKVAFLPLGVQGDLVQRPELRPRIVARLKEVAPMAEAAGVIIGLETALDARGEVALLDEVGSPAIRSYFNFANSLQAGRDLHKELRILGRDRICQIHCTDEDGVWLQDNKRLDMHRVKDTLDDLGWSGWLVIERSRDANNPRDVVGNFGANTRYLKSIFQSS
ncbi:MAG: sugar phosphate isomerase/epimerase family protein [Puniceicoccaceae bacterium]